MKSLNDSVRAARALAAGALGTGTALRRRRSLLALFGLLSAAALSAIANADSSIPATITGTVTDWNGVPVRNAVVIVAAKSESEAFRATCFGMQFQKGGVSYATPIPVPPGPPSPMVPTVMTNEFGQYTIENIVGGDYNIVVMKKSYGCDGNTISLGQSEMRRAFNFELRPPVFVQDVEGDARRSIRFLNLTDRNVTVLYWAYGCDNLAQCGDNSGTMKTPGSGTGALNKILLSGRSASKYLDFSPTPTPTPAGNDPGPAHQGHHHVPADVPFSAQVSYCYFSTVDFPNDKDDFDVVSWPGKDSCRAILAAPPSGW